MRFIIIGAGDVGTSLCQKLSSQQHDVTLIERYEARAYKLTSTLDVNAVIGNGCSADVMLKAGVNFADYLISVADNDEVNVTACLMAKLLNPRIKRIARIRDLNFEHSALSREKVREYFDYIVNPEQAGAEHLFHLFRTPGARDVFEFAQGQLRVLALNISEKSPVLNRTLQSLKEVRGDFPVLVIAIVRKGQLLVPSGKDKIEMGDTVYLLTVPGKTSVLFELAGKTLTPGEHAVIWGARPLVKILVHLLEDRGTSVKVILDNPAIAAEFVDEFRNTLVLEGSGTDQSLLLEENIDEADAFIAAADHDEDNILAALLAKRLGARCSMAVINNASYLPLVTAIGVDAVVSSRIAAASSIFRHIHEGSVISEFSLMHHGATFLELVAQKSSKLLDVPIKKLKLPYGVLIGGIVRQEEVIIPSGEDIIRENDKLVIFVLRSARAKLEKLLNLKLELFS